MSYKVIFAHVRDPYIYCGVASDSIENFAQTTDYPLKFFGVIPQD